MISNLSIKTLNGSIYCNVKKYESVNKFQNAVVFCVDQGYLAYSLFCAQQIINKEKDRSFDICICLPDIKLVPESFRSLDIRFIELNATGMDSLPVDHLSLAAYNRVFLPHIFAEEYDRIVYLDADVYINKPFFKDLMLLCDDFDSDFCVAAAPDITEVNRHSKIKNGVTSKILDYLRVYHESNHLYRNSGVLVFDVQNCIKCDLVERVFGAAFNKSSNLRCHDQSAINIAFMGEMPVIPFEFNWQLHETNYRLIKKVDPYIIHFISRNKPWIFDCEYTQPYVPQYKAFLTENFPEIVQPLKTHAQIRSLNPKYESVYREKISTTISNVKKPWSTFIRNIKFDLYRNDSVEGAIKNVNQNIFTK